MRLFVLLVILGLVAFCHGEDRRISLTRTLIEKARAVGRNNPVPLVAPATDGYDAVKDMLVPPASGEDGNNTFGRPYRLRDFVQGVAELERAPWAKDRKLAVEIKMGDKKDGLQDTVIVTFTIAASGSRPKQTIVWNLVYHGNKLYDANLASTPALPGFFIKIGHVPAR